METKKQRTLAIFALAIALIATTVAYAALATTLQVSGTVTKKGGTWSIIYTNVSAVTATGGAVLTEAQKKVTNENNKLSFSGTLVKPGDSIYFTFKIKNNGSIDAKLNKVELYWNDSKNFTGYEPELSITDKDIVCELLNSSNAVIKDSNKSQLNLTAGATSGLITAKCTYKSYDNQTIDASDTTLNISMSLNYVQA